MRSARVLAGILLVVTSCGDDGRNPTQSPDASTSPGSSTPSSSTAGEGTLRVGVHVPPNAIARLGREWADLPLFPALNNAQAWGYVPLRMVHASLYRLDSEYVPVPDLAAAPCPVSEDGLAITCDLRPAAFHDGTPLTAEDVAYAFELLRSPGCALGPWCLGWLVASAEPSDADTVVVRLLMPYAPVYSDILTQVLIEPRVVLEDAHAALLESAAGIGPAELTAAAGSIDAALEVGATDCRPLLDEAESLLVEIGMTPWSRDEFNWADGGAFDACGYAHYLRRALRDAAAGLELTGIDAVAASYRILSPVVPIGAGPWRVADVTPGSRMRLVAHDAYHHGAPAIDEVELTILRTDEAAVEAVRSAEVDWLVQPFVQQNPYVLREALGDEPPEGLTFSEYVDLSFTGFHYNLREDRLFADIRLREAMEVCFDKEQTIESATDGIGVPIYGPVLPTHWAYEPQLPRPQRDVARGRELIEAAGWTLGDDGVYQRGGRRLAADVYVHGNRADRVRFVELVADQVIDCGIELRVIPELHEILNVAYTWPHVPPGASAPWDILFAPWQSAPDPSPFVFHSSLISSEEQPEGPNFVGYQSPRADELMERGEATYDRRERAELYRELQRVFAEDRPLLFGWTPRILDPRAAGLRSTSGELGEESAFWWWELEALTLEGPDQ